MDIGSIISPLIAMGGIGAVFGVGLGYAGKKLEVEVDPKIAIIREELPGANCAGCGFPGCDSLAMAIADGRAKPNACPVGGPSCAEAIARIMGSENIGGEKVSAFVKCKGDAAVANYQYDYDGILDCNMAVQLAGGGRKNCTYGCIGLGSCEQACSFGAIKIVNRVAVIDPIFCTSCGACLQTCPKKLIELVPDSKDVRVTCNSKDKGKDVKANCAVGCIACKMCEKACPSDAVHVVDNIAKVDYDKCTKCYECTKKCPTKVISGLVDKK